MEAINVLDYLPHRYPFLLVDKVLEVVAGESITAVKNITINEHFFTGHFPGNPVMPGVLVIEALAQAAGILAYITENALPEDGTLYYLAGVDNARFKRIVLPGDQLILTSKFIKTKHGIAKFSATACVGKELACSAELICAKKESRP